MLVTITRTLASGPYRPAARLLMKLDGEVRIRRLGVNLRYSYKVITEVARRPYLFRAFIRNKCCCTRSSPDSGSRPMSPRAGSALRSAARDRSRAGRACGGRPLRAWDGL